MQPRPRGKLLDEAAAFDGPSLAKNELSPASVSATSFIASLFQSSENMSQDHDVINTEVGKKTCRFFERDARTTDAGNDFTILTHICR